MADETERAAMARASGMREADVQRYIQTRRRERIFADIAAECERLNPRHAESRVEAKGMSRESLCREAAMIVAEIESIDRTAGGSND